MIRPEDTALILLAAGLSSRFGDGNKLDEDFLSKPVGMHVVTALENLPVLDRIAVVDGCALDYAARGYRMIHNDRPDEGMARSIRLGVGAARDHDAKAVLICLADMPRVTVAHIHRLFEAADGDEAVVASSDGVSPKPPALFAAAHFDFLTSLHGSAGARELIRGGRHVVTTPHELIDIDTPADLDRLRALVGSPEVVTRAVARRSD